MGTWGTGAFDNDGAADWRDDLDEARPEDRPELIRAALNIVADTDDYIEFDEAVEAIAAAAVVASQLHPAGLQAATARSGENEDIDIAADIPPLGVRALDRLLDDESEWRELWEESGDFFEARAVVEALRNQLDRTS